MNIQYPPSSFFRGQKTNLLTRSWDSSFASGDQIRIAQSKIRGIFVNR